MEVLDKIKDYIKYFFEMKDSTTVYEVVIFYFVLFVIALVLIFFVLKMFKIKSNKDPYEKYETETKELEVKQVKSEENQNKFDLENTLEAMKTTLEDIKEKEIEDFEKLQEEKAIISYEELIKQNNETIIDEEQKPIEETKEKDLQKDYKRSEFISPVYGIRNEYRPKHSEDKNEESKETNGTAEFLDSLKELRKKLDE